MPACRRRWRSPRSRPPRSGHRSRLPYLRCSDANVSPRSTSSTKFVVAAITIYAAANPIAVQAVRTPGAAPRLIRPLLVRRAGLSRRKSAHLGSRRGVRHGGTPGWPSDLFRAVPGGTRIRKAAGSALADLAAAAGTGQRSLVPVDLAVPPAEHRRIFGCGCQLRGD